MNIYEATSMEIRILCAQVGNRTRDLQATMSMLLQLATRPHPPTIGVRQHASDPAKAPALFKSSLASEEIFASEENLPYGRSFLVSGRQRTYT